MNNKLINIIFATGAILLLFSAVLVMENVTWGKYAFGIGGTMYVIARLKMKYIGEDARLKRLNRSYTFNAFIMALTIYLQFEGNNLWVILLFVIALTELFTTFRVAYYEKNHIDKDSAENNQ